MLEHMNASCRSWVGLDSMSCGVPQDVTCHVTLMSYIYVASHICVRGRVIYIYVVTHTIYVTHDTECHMSCHTHVIYICHESRHIYMSYIYVIYICRES